VREAGRGAYSHWRRSLTRRTSTLYFSSSDNSNPLSNGRHYTVEYALAPHPVLIALIGGASLPLYLRVGLPLAPLYRRWRSRSAPGAGALIVGTGIVTFLLPLGAYWTTGRSTPYLIAGLLPWSDASGWLYGAYHFLNDHTLYWWTARRPLNSTFMSFMAALMGEDLRKMLVLKGLVTGLACVLTGLEINQRWGKASALVGFGVLVAFASPFMPTTLTEGQGLAFGATAFALMWQGIARIRVWRFAGGLFLLVLAMSIRPGALFVVPILALWAVFFMPTEPMTHARRGAAVRAVLLSSTIAVGLLVTILPHVLWTRGHSYPGANYAYTFYGLAVGGKPWGQFLADFPEAAALSETEQTLLAYRSAFAEIGRHPIGVITGSWRFFRRYLLDLFAYLGSPVLRLIGTALGLCGLVVASSRLRTDAHCAFLVCGVAGVMLSAPFLFWDTDAYRAFIATGPFEAGLVSLGFSWLGGTVKGAWEPRGSAAEPPPPDGALVVHRTTTLLAVALIVGSTVGPAAMRGLWDAPRFPSGTCAPGLQRVVIHLGRSSPFVGVAPDEGAARRGPWVANRDFHADPTFGNIEIRGFVNAMGPGDLLIHGYDLSPDATTGADTESDRLRWLLGTAAQMPEAGSYYALCVRRVATDPSWISLFRVESAQTITPLAT
jgi:hypothetical protein